MDETNFGIVIDETTNNKRTKNFVDNGIREKKHLFTIQMKKGKPSHLRFNRKHSSEESGSGLVSSEHQMDTLPHVVGEVDQCESPYDKTTSAKSKSRKQIHLMSPVMKIPSNARGPELFVTEELNVPIINIIPNDKHHSTLSIPGVPMDHRGSIVSTNLSVSTMSLLSPSMTSSASFAEGRNDSRISFIVRERLHSLAADMNRRTSQVKEHIQRPPTPESENEDHALGDNENEKTDKHSLQSFTTDFAPSPISHQALDISQLNDIPEWKKAIYQKCCHTKIIPNSLDPQGKKYMAWLVFLSMCFIYNAFAIPLRAAYPYQTRQNLLIWFFFDYFCDAIYLLDMFVIKPRIRFMKGGLPVKTKKDLQKRYFHSSKFKMDLLSILPLDIFYLRIGPNSLLRLPRLLKATSYWELFYLLDSSVKNPYALRVTKTLGNLIYVIHVNSCVFYSLSAWEGLNSTVWTYDGRGNAYLRCFYFATKVATSIGNTADPSNVIENFYMLISWMMGVFIVAMLLGQIRDIVATASKNREEFRKTMDAALQYCATLKVPPEVQRKVREWFIYTWQEQKTLDENDLLEKLPRKLKTDLAIAVHLQTLNKVQLFQECDKAFLRDLVLKLKPVLFLPGDYICKKGEVGKEMYIVSKGMLEVIGGPTNTTVFATLNEGSVFGEVSLLAVGGGNRRTADVKSKGFSNLFVLSKDDLNETIKDYPDAQKIMKRKARLLIKKHEGEGKEKKLDIAQTATVSSHIRTPKLLGTVAQVFNPTSKSGQLLQALLEKENARENFIERDDSDLESETSSILDEVLSGLSVQDILQGRLQSSEEIVFINEDAADPNEDNETKKS